MAKRRKQASVAWYVCVWRWLVNFFSPGKIAGDARSAVIGGLTSAAITFLGTVILVNAQLTFVVGVNSDGFGQPKALFDIAEKEDRKLKLNFVPANLRSTYVCEFKTVTGKDWQAMVLDYLDTYRECFDVSKQGENNYSVYPNSRTNRLTKKQGSYLCKCPS